MMRGFLELIAENVGAIVLAAIVVPLLAVLGGGIGGAMLAVLLVLLELLAVIGVRELCRREGTTFTQIRDEQQRQAAAAKQAYQRMQRNVMISNCVKRAMIDAFARETTDVPQFCAERIVNGGQGVAIAWSLNGADPDGNKVRSVKSKIETNLRNSGFDPAIWKVSRETKDDLLIFTIVYRPPRNDASRMSVYPS